jgi:hypothetical protein
MIRHSNSTESISTDDIGLEFSATVSQTSPKIWMGSKLFDLSFVTGGAFFTLAIAALAFARPSLLPVMFWVWVVVFEGSHFWATFTRTYLDRDFRAKNKSILMGSLVFFLFPALALVVDANLGSSQLASTYGFGIFLWSLYHNARQHFGFMKIYAKKSGISQINQRKLTTALYLCICSSQAYFLFQFKLPGFSASFQEILNSSFGSSFFFSVPVVGSVVGTVFFAKLAYTMYESLGSKTLPTLYYIFVCLVFYSVMFYGIAQNDVFVQNLKGGQTLMLIAIMNSLFHNIQYHAIVRYYGKERYSGNHNANGQNQDRKFGLASWIGSSNFNYMVPALLMGASFGAIVWFVGDWPSISGSWENVQSQSWAHVLFFGIIGHHFFLDQKIWRPSAQKDLSTYLYKQ